MNPSTVFYQTLSSISFTLLGVWFAVVNFGHGGWLTDRSRHRATLHITLHFLIPGTLGLTALLSVPGDGGLVWRVPFIVGGVLGAFESIRFLRDRSGPVGRPQRTLRALDPVLYLALVGAAYVPAKGLLLTAQQVGGMVNGAIFLAGLGYVWLAFAEWAPEDPAVAERDVAQREAAQREAAQCEAAQREAAGSEPGVPEPTASEVNGARAQAPVPDPRRARPTGG